MSKKRKKTMNNFIILLTLTTIVIVVILIYKQTKHYNDIKDDNSSYNEKKKIDNKNTIEESYKKLSNYRKENLNRYLAFGEKNKDYSIEKVVTYVNIGLDYEFYTFVNDADLSKGILVLMNKYHKLDKDYEPDDLEEIDSKYFITGNAYVRNMRKDAKTSFERLSEASIENGTPVYGQSAYRPYTMQENLYNNAVNSLGEKQADIDTARPGYSEHQTGLAIDVSSTKGGNMLDFDSSSSYSWMEENAHKYGFIHRYREEKTSITGFMSESWHYRYVGVEVATDMYNNYPDLTYEEYYDLFIDK